MSENRNVNESELSPKKRRAVVIYMLIIFAAAFFLVAISMFVRMRTMQEDFAAAQDEAGASYSVQESLLQEEYIEKTSNYDTERTKLERKTHETQLLLLAQDAYYHNDSRSFQGYMAELEGCADALSEDAAEIYAELENALRGKNND